jgi:hypothetical protein
MKKFLFALLLLAIPAYAQAMDGSWFGFGAGYENLSSGGREEGASLTLEGGYWYLGNVAYGGYFKPTFLGENNRAPGSTLRLYDLGAFLKAGTEAGLYGKVQLGLAIVDGNTTGLRVEDGLGLSLGLGGGFLFPVTDVFQVGPEVIYRHLTAGDGGDQISVSALVAYGF